MVPQDPGVQYNDWHTVSIQLGLVLIDQVNENSPVNVGLVRKG